MVLLQDNRTELSKETPTPKDVPNQTARLLSSNKSKRPDHLPPQSNTKPDAPSRRSLLKRCFPGTARSDRIKYRADVRHRPLPARRDDVGRRRRSDSRLVHPRHRCDGCPGNGAESRKTARLQRPAHTSAWRRRKMTGLPHRVDRPGRWRGPAGFELVARKRQSDEADRLARAVKPSPVLVRGEWLRRWMCSAVWRAVLCITGGRCGGRWRCGRSGNRAAGNRVVCNHAMQQAIV